MDKIDRHKHSARLLCSYSLNKVYGEYYIFHNPAYDIVYRSYIVYDEAIDDVKYNEWPSDKDNIRRLCLEGLCSNDIDKDIDNLYNILDNMKVDMYHKILRLDLMEKIRKKLRNKEKHLFKLLQVRHSLDYLTMGYFAEKKRNEFIVENCLYDIDKKRVKNPPSNLVTNVYLKHLEQMCQHDELRELSQNDPWNIHWSIYGLNLFSFGKKYELSDEQKSIIKISQLYDDARVKGELHDERILKDKDLFDGWRIHQHNEYKKNIDKEGTHLPKLGKGVKPGAEMFVPVTTQEELDYVNSMNTGEAQFTKDRRKAVIQNKEVVSESQLPDKQEDLRMATIQQRKG